MTEQSIYKDIAERTGGDIYIGVVGPVRSGKSTLITRFMEELVLPNIAGDYSRERARDEMPQSAAGRTVMTTEPKFVPDEAVPVSLADGASLRVKMIDCVGYMIPEALGAEENGDTRMVRTPWREEPMPFAEAAEFGTRKVIGEHATIGLLVTSDGTVGDIPRTSYEEAETRIVNELKAMGKPFAVVLNSSDPTREGAARLAETLESRFGVPVALVNCLSLTGEDIRGILSLVLGEFPVTALSVTLPAWTRALPAEHPVRRSVTEDVCRMAEGVRRMDDVAGALAGLSENDCVEKAEVTALDMGSGRAAVTLTFRPELYYDVLSELAGVDVREEATLLTLLRELTEAKRKYDRVADALESAEATGYGIVMPEMADLTLERPVIAKQSGGYGVRLSAAAPSLHIIKADIRTELNPIVGTEQQSEDFVRNILADFESDPQKLWNSKLFGRTLYELVGDGLKGKLAHMPEEARRKLSETLARIINEGANGLLCILL